MPTSSWSTSRPGFSTIPFVSRDGAVPDKETEGPAPITLDQSWSAPGSPSACGKGERGVRPEPGGRASPRQGDERRPRLHSHLARQAEPHPAVPGAHRRAAVPGDRPRRRDEEDLPLQPGGRSRRRFPRLSAGEREARRDAARRDPRGAGGAARPGDLGGLPARDGAHAPDSRPPERSGSTPLVGERACLRARLPSGI